jgi:hypothetical protein
MYHGGILRRFMLMILSFEGFLQPSNSRLSTERNVSIAWQHLSCEYDVHGVYKESAHAEGQAGCGPAGEVSRLVNAESSEEVRRRAKHRVPLVQERSDGWVARNTDAFIETQEESTIAVSNSSVCNHRRTRWETSLWSSDIPSAQEERRGGFAFVGPTNAFPNRTHQKTLSVEASS